MQVLPRIVFKLLKCLRLSPLCPVLFGVHLQLIRAHLFYARPLPSTLEREGLRLASCFSGILSSVWPALHSAKWHPNTLPPGEEQERNHSGLSCTQSTQDSFMRYHRPESRGQGELHTRVKHPLWGFRFRSPPAPPHTPCSCENSRFRRSEVYTVDPWTAQVWTEQVHIYAGTFQKIHRVLQCIFSSLWLSQEHFIFSSLLYWKNTVYSTYNMQSMCSAVYVISKRSGQQ